MFTVNVLPLSCHRNKLQNLYIPPQLWPPNSPDFLIQLITACGNTAREGEKTCITDLDELKQRLRTEWAKLDYVVIAAAIRQWRCRLSACVKADDGHFEHRL